MLLGKAVGVLPRALSRQAPFLGNYVAVGIERHQRLVEVAMILALEDQHLLAAGSHARDADRLMCRGRSRLEVSEA